jgi:hypothetical protein
MLKLIPIVPVLALALAACSQEGGGAAPGPAGGSAKPAATAKSTAAAATATAKAAEAKLTEYDLSAAGDKWKGYVAQLPREGAKVMADGSDGARLATNGREENPFDIAWAPGKGLLKDVKKGLEAAGKDGKVKFEFKQDTAEGLEWVASYEGGTKTYHFDLVMKVGTADFHCYTLPMGVDNEEQLKKHKDACKTLVKK